MNNSNKAETMRNLASKYLQKYDDVFTPKGYSSSNWAYEYSVIQHVQVQTVRRAFEVLLAQGSLQDGI